MRRQRVYVARPETPLRAIEGEAFGVSMACMQYRSTTAERDQADSQHDQALALAKARAREIGAIDIVALIETAEQHDAIEDAAYRCGDDCVVIAHEHGKAIACAVEAFEQADRQMGESL